LPKKGKNGEKGPKSPISGILAKNG